MLIEKVAKLRKFICCPNCYSDLMIKDELLLCSKCHFKFNIVDRSIPSFILNDQQENLSKDKWEKLYLKKEFLDGVIEAYKSSYLKKLKRQVLKYTNHIKSNARVFLEIGSGLGFLGEEFAKSGWFFIGIDFSINALLLSKKRLEENCIENYLLIHADICNLPLKKGTVDLTFGGGTIEHFKDTQIIINGLFRVLKNGGVAFNSVPFLNFANFFYRLKWGGIPNVPLIKNILSFININILKGKHMIFGYELQFSENQLVRLHEKAGFKRNMICVNRFDCNDILQFDCVKNEKVKKLFTYLCNNFKQFWPAVEVVAQK